MARAGRSSRRFSTHVCSGSYCPCDIAKFVKFVVQGPFSKFQFGDECAHRMSSSGVSPSLSNIEALSLTRSALFVLVAIHPLATNLLKLHKPRTFGLILARFGHISATSRPFAAFYSTNRIYSASLTRLHAPPVLQTRGCYRNHKLCDITGARTINRTNSSIDQP